MGINIGICETEAKGSLCRELKQTYHKVKLDDIEGFEDAVNYDEFVPLDEAKKIFPDWEGFMKRNRINAGTDAIYLDKIKKDDDLILLKKESRRISTGWVDLDRLNDADKTRAIDASKAENRISEWDLIEFDEMNTTCARCPLSWDKGRGCIGSFGPNNSLLPGIAEKYGCRIIASAPDAAGERRIFPASDAPELQKEVEKLTAVLPDEGKMMVRRYSGPLERLGLVARIAIDENCGFYFF